MNAIREKNPKCLRERIDPERRAREAGMAVGAEWKYFPSRAAVAGVDVPAEPAPRGKAPGCLHAGHQLHRFGTQDAHTVKFAEVEEHPGVAGEIGGGSEEASVTGHATHKPRCRIVHRAAQYFSINSFGRRDARQL